jgi:predicted ArsR family transcriptional regulator
MKTTVSRYDFERAFVDADRKENFTYEGIGLLFDYLEDYEEQTGEELELDVIALCCDYAEEDTHIIARDYSIDIEGMDDEEILEAVRDYLNDNTTLVGETSTGFVYACF